MVFVKLIQPSIRHASKKLSNTHRYEFPKWMSTMKAAVINEIGKPIQLIEIERPGAPQANQVKIQVKYSCADTLTLENIPKVPFIPGYEIVGEVMEIGSEVTPDIAIVGESVVALNLDNYNGFAQECTVNSNDVFRIPGNVNHKHAAVLPFGYATALYAFSQLCKPPPKEKSTLLISCGAAGLGIAALDIAAGIFKAKVIGITDTEERSELMRHRGAFAAISLNDKNLRKRILKRTEGKEVDYVFDAIGEDNLKNMMNCVKLGGSIISAKISDDTVLKPPLNTHFSIVDLCHLRIQDPSLYRQVILDTLELADQGVLRPHVCSEYKLEQIDEAMKFIESKKSTGKVLIDMICVN